MERKRYHYLKDCDTLLYLYSNVVWIIIPFKRTYYIKITFFSLSPINIKKNLGNFTVRNIVNHLLDRQDYITIQGIGESTVKELYGELMK